MADKQWVSVIQYKGKTDNFTSEGNGPISAFVKGIREKYNLTPLLYLF